MRKKPNSKKPLRAINRDVFKNRKSAASLLNVIDISAKCLSYSVITKFYAVEIRLPRCLTLL